MIVHFKTISPINLKDAAMLVYEVCSVESVSCFEDETAPMSDQFDENGLPISSVFIIEGYGKSEQFKELEIMLNSINLKIEMNKVDLGKKYIDTLNDIEIFPFFITKTETNNNSFPHTIKIQAATAFGSGDHQTTKGCLKALASLRDEKIESVADIGCGSSILSIAATKLWPNACVIGVDNDEESVEVSKFHSRINNSNISIYLGSGTKPLKDERFDLIVANILAKPLIEMSDDFIKRSNKYIILSGFLTFQLEEIKKAYSDFSIKNEITIDDWVTLILQKKD